MRVALSASVWDDGRSGIGTYLCAIVPELRALLGDDLVLIGPDRRILPQPQIPQHAGRAGVGSLIAPLRDVAWHRRGLGALAAAHRCDVVHVPTIRRLPGALSCPGAVTVHDLAPLRMSGKYGLLRDLFHRRLIPRWLRGMAGITAPSRSTRDDLAEFYGLDPARVTLIPHAVDHACYRPGDRAESTAMVARLHDLNGPYFVYLSRLEHPAKNHVRLIDGFLRARAEAGSTLPHTLVLVGDRWHGSEAITAAAAPHAPAIRLLGRVPRDHLPHLLRASDALLYPSLYEGFGLPILEAMACGTPVACSRSSSLTELAEGRGLLFDPLQPDAIADAILRLSRDAALRQDLSARGLAFAAEFTWAASARALVAFWRTLSTRTP